MTQKKLYKKELALDGALKTFEDPTKIKPNDFRQLINMRYKRGGVRAIGGQTRITTTPLGSGVDNMFHFRKSYPGTETHLLASRVSGGSSYVYPNTTAIPSAGDFGSAMFTGSGTGLGRFAATPNGGAVYCNGTDSALWYGTWYPVSQFIDWDRERNSYKYNWTEQVTNNLTTASQLATLHSHDDAIDSSVTEVLYKLDNDATDSSGNGLNATKGAGASYSNSSPKTGFGYYGVFANQANSYFYRAGSDFAFMNTGDWTVDCISRPTSGQTDLWCLHDGSVNNTLTLQSEYLEYTAGPVYARYTLTLIVGGASKLSINTGYRLIGSSGTDWNHVAVCGTSTGYYYVYVNGYLAASGYATSGTPVFDATGGYMQIGAGYPSGVLGNYYVGNIDEFRVSSSRLYSADFTPPTYPYGDGTDVCELYVGSLLPVDLIYFEVEGGSGGTSLIGNYWNGSGWTNASVVDGTSALASSGYITFAGGEGSNGVTLHKATVIDDLFLYWYKITVTGVTSGDITVSNVKVQSPMQQIQELWDGIYRPPAGFQKYDESATLFMDYTTNVFEDWYDSANTATYAELHALAAGDADSGDYFVVGSLERLIGVNIGVAGGWVNDATSAMTVHYWNGSAWIPMATQDGTSSAGITLSKSGTVSWENVAQQSEFPQNIGVIQATSAAATGRSVRSKVKSSNPDVPSSTLDLYYYKFTFSAALSGSEQGGSDPHLWVYSVKGIPAQNEVRGYTFPLLHDDRLWLCGNKDFEPNSTIYSDAFRCQVFNGDNCGKLPFGDNKKLVAGVSFSNQFAATTQKMAMFFKDNETWKVVGEFPYTVHQVSDTDGCVAPLSLAVSEVEMAAGFKRKVAVWLSQRGVVISDGNTITEISQDIRDKFEPTHTNYLGASVLATAKGFVDSTRNEYHLVFSDGSEWVYDFTYSKWFEIDRGSYPLLGGCSVIDTNGASYCYGFDTSGHVTRLEYGTSNVGEAITCYLGTTDLALDQNYITEETVVRGIRFLQVAKASLGANMTCTHYGDSYNVGTSMASIDPTASGYRLDSTAELQRLGPHITHSFQFSVSSSAQAIPMWEPELLSILYEYAREGIRAERAYSGGGKPSGA